MPGFGSLPGPEGDAGIPVPRPPESNEQQTTDDIHAIKAKYVDGNTNFRVPLQLAANATARLDMTGQRVNSITLVAATGVIFGYLFDVSGNAGKAAWVPDYCVSAGVVPSTIQIMVPERDDYVLSWQEGANAAATGSARIQKL